MCGIAGIIRYGKTPISEVQIALLLTGNEFRGNDASGIALSQIDGSIQVFKRDIPAWKFVADKEYKEFIEKNLKATTWGALLHTRAATQGNPRDNNNNHPLYAGVAAIIHNGSVHNDDTMFREMNLDRKAETDSDIIRAIVDKSGITEESIKKMNRLCGSIAGAAFDPRYPQKMLLFKSGSPMKLASTDDMFFFSSEKVTLHKAMKPYVKRFGTFFQVDRVNAAFCPMAEHSIWIMGSNGQEHHAEFKTQVGDYHNPNRQVYDNYATRQEKWNREKRNLVSARPSNKVEVKEGQCPKCNKIWTLPINEAYNDYFCNKDNNGCDTRLVEPFKKEKVN